MVAQVKVSPVQFMPQTKNLAPVPVGKYFSNRRALLMGEGEDQFDGIEISNSLSYLLEFPINLWMQSWICVMIELWAGAVARPLVFVDVFFVL
jgi:hypothetical protein